MNVADKYIIPIVAFIAVVLAIGLFEYGFWRGHQVAEGECNGKLEKLTRTALDEKNAAIEAASLDAASERERAVREATARASRLARAQGALNEQKPSDGACNWTDPDRLRVQTTYDIYRKAVEAGARRVPDPVPGTPTDQ